MRRTLSLLLLVALITLVPASFANAGGWDTSCRCHRAEHPPDLRAVRAASRQGSVRAGRAWPWRCDDAPGSEGGSKTSSW